MFAHSKIQSKTVVNRRRRSQKICLSPNNPKGSKFTSCEPWFLLVVFYKSKRYFRWMPNPAKTWSFQVSTCPVGIVRQSSSAIDWHELYSAILRLVPKLYRVSRRLQREVIYSDADVNTAPWNPHCRPTANNWNKSECSRNSLRHMNSGGYPGSHATR